MSRPPFPAGRFDTSLFVESMRDKSYTMVEACSGYDAKTEKGPHVKLRSSSMVTVIIPSFNRRALTERAVKSVLAQTYRDFRILVVDDHSREEEVYQPDPGYGSHVRVIRHSKNAGVSAARNTGVKEAEDSLIAFLDSDDYWLPERLESQVSLFNQQREPDKVLLYASYYSNDNKFWTKTPFFPLRHRQAVSDYLFLDYGCMHVDTWLATKNLLMQVPFSSELKQSEDWDVLLRIEALGGRFVYVPKPCAVRNVDLRAERLTTTTHVESHRRFLERNRARLTPRSCALFEALFVKRKHPSVSPLENVLTRTRLLTSTPRLTLGRRLRLVWSYLVARMLHKLYKKFYTKPATRYLIDPTSFIVMVKN
jgi:glycosyltransferase involved in cell wall biosynthesis